MAKPAEKAHDGSLPETVTGRTLAALIGLTDRQVRNLADEGIVIRSGRRGRYELASSVANILERAETRGTDEATAIRSGYIKARKEALELQTAEKRGEMMPVSEVNFLLDQVWATIRDRMQGFGARLTRDPAERRRIDAAVDELRNQVADDLSKAADQFRPGADAPSAPQGDDDVNEE